MNYKFKTFPSTLLPSPFAVDPSPLRPIVSGPANSVKNGDMLSVYERYFEVKCESIDAKPAARLHWERVYPDGRSVVLENAGKRLTHDHVCQNSHYQSPSFDLKSSIKFGEVLLPKKPNYVNQSGPILEEKFKLFRCDRTGVESF